MFDDTNDFQIPSQTLKLEYSRNHENMEQDNKNALTHLHKRLCLHFIKAEHDFLYSK